MAIKNLDPRKLHDLDLSSHRFDQVVADAWASRHGDELDATTAMTSTRAGLGHVPPDYRSNDPTYQPFAGLKDRLRHH